MVGLDLPGPSRGPGVLIVPGRAPFDLPGGRFPVGAQCREPLGLSGPADRALAPAPREVGRERGLEAQLLAGERMGEGRAGRCAGTGARGRGGRRSRSADRPATGWPIAAKWARTWWVRPVSSRASTRVSAGKVSSTLKWVRASRAPRPRTARRSGARWSRPSGASIVPERDRGCPSTNARYSRSTSRALIIARESPVGLVVAGDDHQPGGVAIESVDDPGRAGLAAAEQLAEQVDEGRLPRLQAPGGRPGRRGFSITASHSSMWTSRGWAGITATRRLAAARPGR